MVLLNAWTVIKRFGDTPHHCSVLSLCLSIALIMNGVTFAGAQLCFSLDLPVYICVHLPVCISVFLPLCSIDYGVLVTFPGAQL